MTQQLIVYLIGAVVAVYIVRRVVLIVSKARTRRQRRDGGCACCDGCSCGVSRRAGKAPTDTRK